MIDWWIIEKSLNKKLTPQEKKCFDEWLEATPKHRVLYDKIKYSGDMDNNAADFDRWRQAFQEKLTTRKRQEKKRIFLKLTVAAAVLFLFLGGGYWFNNSLRRSPKLVI